MYICNYNTSYMSKKNSLEKLPKPPANILFLIAQELKIRKFFNALHEAGIDDCYFQPYLETLIFSEMGLHDQTDEAVRKYSMVIEKHSKKIKPSRESIAKQSLKVYTELAAEKAKQKENLR